MLLNYGQKNQVSFANEYEYYYALGFLANDNHAELHWEHNENQGAWGSEGRIHCLVPQHKFPNNFNFTAGIGRTYARINCNDYVKKLIDEHNFSYNGYSNDLNNILSTVPEEYIDIFMNGYNA